MFGQRLAELMEAARCFTRGLGHLVLFPTLTFV